MTHPIQKEPERLYPRFVGLATAEGPLTLEESFMSTTQAMPQAAPYNDISGEEFRQYHFFANGGVATLEIKHPLKIIGADGGHYIEAADGFRHFIPSTWFHLVYKLKDGAQDAVWPKAVSAPSEPAPATTA